MKKLLSVLCCVGMSTLVLAQDKPAPGGAPKKEDPKPAAGAPAAKQDAPKASPEAEQLMLALARKLTDKDELVRKMAEGALVAGGKASLPTLQAIASGQDKDLAAAAKKVIDRIEKGGDRPRGPGMMGGDMSARVEQIAKDMNLDEKKTQKLKDAQKAAMDKMNEIRESVQNGEMTREEAMQAMQESRENIKADLKKSGFTDEEVTKLEQQLMGGGMRGRGQGGGGRGGRGGQGGGGG